MPNDLVPAQFDAELLTFIRARGSRITVRELSRSLATCREPGAAKKRLEQLVRAGMGRWTYLVPGLKGGQQARQFVLSVEGMVRASDATASKLRGSRQTRQIAREMVAFLNQYQSVPCSRICEALVQVTKIMEGLSKAQGEHVLPMGRRTVRLSQRGAVTSTWRYP